MRRCDLATSSGSEESLFGLVDQGDQAQELEKQAADFHLFGKTGFSTPRKTDADRQAIDDAWAGADDLENVTAYVVSKNRIYNDNQNKVYADNQDGRAEKIADQKMAKIKLAGKKLSGINLDNRLLAQSQFQWSDLINASFRNSNLLQTNFHAATLLNADFTEADSFSVDLSETSAIGAIFNGAHLEVGNLDSAYMPATEFVGAKLRGICARNTNFYGANFNGARLDEANLEEADLSHANLKKADLRKARLLKTNFSDANLDGAQLEGSSFFPSYDDLDENNLTEHLDCYAKFYIHHETQEVNKSLYHLREYMRKDLIEKIKMKLSRIGLEGVENLITIAFKHPVFSVHKKRSTYCLNNIFSKDADENAIRTSSQRAFAACHKQMIKEAARLVRH